MKTLKLVMLATFHLSVAWGQTAEEILCKTEDEYRKHVNYIDKGQQVSEIYGDQTMPGGFAYLLAMDRDGNIYHWINEFSNRKIIGAIYKKEAGELNGSYQRLGIAEEPFPCSAYEAGGRLLATGGGILWLAGSLFYPDYLEETPGDASQLQFYDSVQRLPDTLLGDKTCYVVETTKKFLITEKMADDSNRRGDSIRETHGLPPIHQSPPFKKLPGELTLKAKFYIHYGDFLIVQFDESKYDISQLKSSRSLKMHPLFDVKDFNAYLKE